MIADAQDVLASMVASTSSADGTSVSYTQLQNQRVILESMQMALKMQLQGLSRPRRTRRVNLSDYSRSRRWMRP